MGKVTFLSLPPTCWKELFNSVCLAIWSGAPSSFSASLLVQSFSLLSRPLAPLCVWKQLLPHLYHGAAKESSPAAARGASLATADCGTSGAIVVPARLTEPYLARTWARLHRALPLFSLLTGLLSPPKLWPSSAAGSHVRENIREMLEQG